MDSKDGPNHTEAKPSSPKGKPGQERSRWIAALAVSFLALLLSLLALAVVPIFLDQQEVTLERSLAVSSGARTLFSEIEFVHSQEMLRIEEYVNSGDASFIALYQDHAREEIQLYDALRVVIDAMPPTYGVALGLIESDVNEWRFLHAPLMGGGPLSIDPFGFRENMGDDRARYESVQASVRALEDRVIRDEAAAVSRLERRSRWGFWVTVGAIGLAVLGAVSMVFVGLSLQNLAQGETQLRRKTVAARRDLRSILGGTADGLVGVDLDGNCTFLNEAGARLLGYSPSELRGEPVHRRIHHTKADGGEHTEQECPVHTALASGATVHVPDDVLWRKDGTSFPVQLIVSPMKDVRRVRGVVLTFTDMTDIRAAEAALRDAVRARDEVLALVSHDLRNPVGTIAAAAELLEEVPMPRERQAEHLEIIGRAAYRINRLIQDLLDVAQIEAGRLSVRAKAVDIVGVVKEVVSQMRWKSEERRIDLAVRVPTDLPAVKADRDRLVQVMANLVDNGLKFTPADGTVTIAASHGPNGVSVSVSDTGRGIEPELERHLFDRFWQGHAAGTRGAGLGLAIVQGILQAHGAEMRVDTEVGRGSSFAFTLPTAD